MDDVIAVVPDLFFQSRISAAAKSAGRSVRFVPGEAVGKTPYRLALVDLDVPSDAGGVIACLRAQGGGPIVAFGPHVDTAARKAARAAGAHRVLARSKFVTELPAIMRSRDPEPGDVI